ncbi:MAG: GNAT family N-acetyltransferase, partial [Planctomycetes bacterium]|nr:GNAT family N-acetyltransferase [Planctomycetota bacterium]
MNLTTTAAVAEISSDERRQIEPRIAEWLLEEPGHSLLGTYPQLFGDDVDVTSFGIRDEDGRIVSHAAVRRLTAWTSPGPVAVTLVGAVTTAPEARGEQHASRLLHHIADREVSAGQDAILLWSDRWEFYAKLGYAIAGTQAEVVYAPADLEPDAAARPFESRDVPALTEIHARKPWRIERDECEMRMLLEGTACDVFVLERDDRVVAYACHGKGVDLGGWWHEFGGDDADALRIGRHGMAVLGQASATWMVPPFRNELFDELLGAATEVREGAVALSKPLTEKGRRQFFVDG